jgi:hypothetical protein
VVKRRVHDNFTGAFALSMWFRFTSTNNNGTNNPLFTISIYNRTGLDTTTDADNNTAYHGRLWLDQHGNNRTSSHASSMPAPRSRRTLATSSTGQPAVYAAVDTSYMQNGAGTHNYEPSASSGRLDRAGGWHWAMLAVDLSAKKYIGCCIDGRPFVDLSSYSLDKTTSSGFAGMHFSAEYPAS